MKINKFKLLLGVVAAFFGGVAIAQDAGGDVGLVNSLQGDVSYQGKDGPARKAQPYMRLRHGDKVSVAAGGAIRISYTTANRQESWTGPSSFVATSGGASCSRAPSPRSSNCLRLCPRNSPGYPS